MREENSKPMRVFDRERKLINFIRENNEDIQNDLLQIVKGNFNLKSISKIYSILSDNIEPEFILNEEQIELINSFIAKKESFALSGVDSSIKKSILKSLIYNSEYVKMAIVSDNEIRLDESILDKNIVKFYDLDSFDSNSLINCSNLYDTIVFTEIKNIETISLLSFAIHLGLNVIIFENSNNNWRDNIKTILSINNHNELFKNIKEKIKYEVTVEHNKLVTNIEIYKTDDMSMLSRSTIERNLLVEGKAGSGKTTRELLPSLIESIKSDNPTICFSNDRLLFNSTQKYIADNSNCLNMDFKNKKLLLNEKEVAINLLSGNIKDITNTFERVLDLMLGKIPPFFEAMRHRLIYNSIYIVKSLYGDEADIYDLKDLLVNKDKAIEMIEEFKNTYSCENENEWKPYYTFFKEEYLKEKCIAGDVFSNDGGFRSFIYKLTKTELLNDILYRRGFNKGLIDFDSIINSPYVNHIYIYDLEDLLSSSENDKHMNLLISEYITSSIKNSLIKRKYIKGISRQIMMYLDEGNLFINDNIINILKNKNDYRVLMFLSMQDINSTSYKDELLKNIDNIIKR